MSIVIKSHHPAPPPRDGALAGAVAGSQQLGVNPLLGFICVTGVLLAAHVTIEVWKGENAGPDRAILLALRTPGHLETPVGPSWMLQSAIDLSALGGFTFIWLFTAAVAGFLILIKRWAALVVFLAAILGASVLNAVFKLGLHRARPEVVPHLAEVSNASFPSGHAMISAATYLTVGALLAHTQGSRAVRIYLLTIAVVLTVLIGLSRLYLGVHWPSDVLAGWLFGAAWALAFWLWRGRRRARPPQAPPTKQPLRRSRPFTIDKWIFLQKLGRYTQPTPIISVQGVKLCSRSSVMIRAIFSVLLLSSTSLLANVAFAQDVLSPSRFAIGVSVGTTGGIIEGSYKLTPQLILRGQGAFIDFDESFKSSDVKYAGRLKFNTGGGFVDLHPLSNPWLLSAGAVSGDRRVTVTAHPSASGVIKIHGVDYPVTEVGSVNGDIDFGATAPFVGFGWDNTFYTTRKIGFRAMAGIIFGDSDPNVKLQAVGPFATDPTVLSNLAAEQTSLQHDARDFRYYPVAQVGLNYRF